MLNSRKKLFGHDNAVCRNETRFVLFPNRYCWNISHILVIEDITVIC